MSFDRHRAQLVCEKFAGCLSFGEFFDKDWRFIEALSLDRMTAVALSDALKDDAKDYYFKGYISLLESLSNFKNRNYSWAVIKGYYSVFYMLRADLAVRGVALIRHKTIYYLESKEYSTPTSKGRKDKNRNEYTGDHKSTLRYFEELFGTSDTLLSQNIEDMSAYQWLMKKRERVNYQERSFCEPNVPDFLDLINEKIINSGFDNLIQEIINDEFILTFQTEYAAIAIPVKRAILTRNSFNLFGITEVLTSERIEYLKESFKIQKINIE